jgi:hypothetical protein
MARRVPRPRLGLLARRVGLGFEFVGELIELVEIDSRPEPEGVWNGLWRRVPTRLRLLAETGTERAIDDIPERHSKFPRATLQEAGQIVIDGECGAHIKHHECGKN